MKIHEHSLEKKIDKEKLVFEIFKEQIKKQYIEILKVGTKVKNGKNIYWELEQYCKKVGADYSKVRNLADEYKAKLYFEEKSKEINHIIDFYADGKGISLHTKIKSNLRKKQRDSVEQFLKRNSKDGNKGF